MDNYKELYEKEKAKNIEYIEKLARLEEEKNMLAFRLDRIHNNPIWKVTRPVRDMMLKSSKLIRRIRNLGGPRGVMSKILYKIREAKAKKNYGTKSFPDAARRKMEENCEFKDRPLISILVPLYNTPKNFLKEMIDSVRWQTYDNWQLCLADGSDESHAYV